MAVRSAGLALAADDDARRRVGTFVAQLVRLVRCFQSAAGLLPLSPGFLDNPEAAETVREAWTGGDPLVTQIDWEELYRANDLRGDSSAAYVVASERQPPQERAARVQFWLTIRRHG